MKELAAWYQKKISSYDKAEWEMLVEQLLVRSTYRRRVVDFSTHIPRSYLIDVDLVRGSSFPKAKPTLGVWRVVWLALIRLLLLPGLFRWWRQQTSPTCVRLLLALWLLQLLNLLLYFLAPAHSQIECDSVLVPLALMVGLSVVHAHIVSTTALELGRVRPRHTAKRKLPNYFRYFRRTRHERSASGGSPGSAESGATPKQCKPAAGGKPVKLRRRASLARGKPEDKPDDGLRKRKATLDKNATMKGSEAPANAKPAKAKDSDDEDYMDWKRPSVSPPTVTFTPPPEENASKESPFVFRPNLLTRRRLATFDVQEDLQNHNVARLVLADGDDGFESLNGNNSNGSDNEREKRLNAENMNMNHLNVNRSALLQCKLLESALKKSARADRGQNTDRSDPGPNDPIKSKLTNVAPKDSAPNNPEILDPKYSGLNISEPNNSSLDPVSNAAPNDPAPTTSGINDSGLNASILSRNEPIDTASNSCGAPNEKPKDANEKDKDWAEDATDSPGKSKRPGVRFRNSWVQEMIEQESSDDVPPSPKTKAKKSNNVQTSSSEGGCETASASAPSIGLPSHHTMSDWVGQTTNSEDCSYSSQSEGSQSDVGYHYADNTWDPFSILNPASDTVKCLMWEKGDMVKAELSAVDISWCVVARAERAMAADGGYLWAGVAMATAIALISPVARLLQVAVQENEKVGEESAHWLLRLPWLLLSHSEGSVCALLAIAFGGNPWVLAMNVISCFLRFALSGLCFFLLAVAERAYKQRFLYAKLFSHLTSARRARKSELPHFRLHTVRNIKTWLSARSYLRRRGPQRSVDVIVSAAFVVTLTLLACVAAQLLRESVTVECGWVLEVMVWCGCLGVYLLRLLTLGSNVNRKYRGCLSAIITEQINLHLAIEQRPGAKDKYTVANNVLKLAADLLKELDAPFKISGICANHYLYTITKVVILSALSGVLSEMLGFKLKLDKIKIK